MQPGEVMVGVDVSMVQLDVARWPSGENFSVSNDAQGVEQLLTRMMQVRPRGDYRGQRRTGRSTS